MGRSVVTANKEVMARHGPDLLSLAGKHGAALLYEASVGGGIPIISPSCATSRRTKSTASAPSSTAQLITS
jgi:homoserine dehydrogenase